MKIRAKRWCSGPFEFGKLFAFAWTSARLVGCECFYADGLPGSRFFSDSGKPMGSGVVNPPWSTSG